MLNDHALDVAETHWASSFGCAREELFAEPLRLIPHAEDLADFNGAFALFRLGAATASVPRERIDSLRTLVASLSGGCSPQEFAAALRPIATVAVGPAYIGYATTVVPPPHPVQMLISEDAGAILAMQQACDPTEWEHGSSSSEDLCAGVFVGEELVAFAGYEVWSQSIAHISIVTHPGFRGRGYGRSAVAHLARHALAARLLPQYRTLASNRPSIRIAESLGFQPFAESMAVRFTPNT